MDAEEKEITKLKIYDLFNSLSEDGENENIEEFINEIIEK